MSCIKDESYKKTLQAYCKYIEQCFDYAQINIEFAMKRRQSQNLPFALVMDFDGIFMAEGDCLGDEMFQCTLAFVQYIHHTYGDRLPIYIVTARITDKDIIKDLATFRVSKYIKEVLYDKKRQGTKASKLANRDKVRSDGYTILCSIGDNVLDLVTENETDGYADTINVLLPNVWRHRSLR